MKIELSMDVNPRFGQTILPIIKLLKLLNIRYKLAIFTTLKGRILSIPEINKVVQDYYDIPDILFQSKTRKREIVQARQVAMYFSKKLTNNSLTVIGVHIGGRAHTTVLHSCKTVNDLMDTDRNFKQQVLEIEERL